MNRLKSSLLLAACLLGMASAAGNGTVTNPFEIPMVDCGAVVDAKGDYNLTESTSIYFAFTLGSTQCTTPAPKHAPKVIDVLMRRTSAQGDPDLIVYGGLFPDTYRMGTDSTTNADHAVELSLEWTTAETTKMFLVEVRAFGSSASQFQIGAIASTCPADVKWSGGSETSLTATECGSSSGRGTCAPTGVCSCKDDTHLDGSKYVLPDCSGFQYPSHPLGSTNKYTVAHYVNEFVPFSVDNSTYELIIDVVTTKGATASPSLFIGGPGGSYKYTTQDWNDKSVRIILSVDPQLPRADFLNTFGDWALRLQASNSSDPKDADKSSDVAVSITENKCPSGCTGSNGKCNATTHICTCTALWTGYACSSPVTVAVPDQLTYDGEGTATRVSGSGLTGQKFSLNQEETLTLRLKIESAPPGSTFQINVDAVDIDKINTYCPAYPVLSLNKDAPTSSLAPDRTTCYGANMHPNLTVSGPEWQHHEGEWHLTIYAAGFTGLNFTVSATVSNDRIEAMTEASLEACTTNQAKTEASLEACEANAGGGGGSSGSTGTPKGIAALLFFIGGILGVVGGVVLAKFVLVPKGIGFQALEPATPSSSVPTGLSFTNNDGGHSLLKGNDNI